MNTPTPAQPGQHNGTLASRASLQSTTGRIAAVAIALLLVLFLVLSVSRAAFTASTDNTGNSVATDVITLTDNDAGTALFSLTGVAPGVATEQCIHVRYDGDFSSGDIKIFATPTGASTELGDLADYLEITVEREELANTALVDDATHSCAAFDAANLLSLTTTPEVLIDDTLADFPADHANGASAFIAEESTHAFKITVEVQDNPAAAGATANWDFVWETQSA